MKASLVHYYYLLGLHQRPSTYWRRRSRCRHPDRSHPLHLAAASGSLQEPPRYFEVLRWKAGPHCRSFLDFRQGHRHQVRQRHQERPFTRVGHHCWPRSIRSDAAAASASPARGRHCLQRHHNHQEVLASCEAGPMDCLRHRRDCSCNFLPRFACFANVIGSFFWIDY